MTRKQLLSDEPFSYRATKDGLVLISYHGRVVTTLAGARASQFNHIAESGDAEALQIAMAKATGHFKHANER